MIEVVSSKAKCDLSHSAAESEVRDGVQLAAYLEVIEAFSKAYELFNEYKFKYGTDKDGINRLLRKLNGG